MLPLFTLSLRTLALFTTATTAAFELSPTVSDGAATTSTAKSTERLKGAVIECLHGRRPARQYHQRCECREKWSGRFCDRPTCVHGELNDAETLCSCRYGWTGDHCDTPACGANGRAKVVAPDSNIYICECDDGYSGDRCEIRFVSEPAESDKNAHAVPLPLVNVCITAVCATLLLIVIAYGCKWLKLGKYCRRHGDEEDSTGSSEGLRYPYVHPLLASPFTRPRIESLSSYDLPPSYDDATRPYLEDRPPSYSAEIVALYVEGKEHGAV